MSDVKQTNQQEQTNQQPNQQIDNNVGGSAEIVTDEMKSYFKTVLDEVVKKHDTETQKQKNEIAGLNRKNSELVNKLTEYQKKELTIEQQIELKEKELKNKELLFIKRENISDFPFLESEEKTELINYISGEDEEEIKNNIKYWKNIIDKAVKAGIEKGIQERLSQSFKPQTSINPTSNNSFENMSNEELASKANEISKMPSSKEKLALFDALMQEQAKRMKN